MQEKLILGKCQVIPEKMLRYTIETCAKTKTKEDAKPKNVSSKCNQLSHQLTETSEQLVMWSRF